MSAATVDVLELVDVGRSPLGDPALTDAAHRQFADEGVCNHQLAGGGL